jgi:hypothetical protein
MDSREIPAVDMSAEIESAIEFLAGEGIIYRHQRPHQEPGCDGMMTCDCPPPTWRLTSKWAEWLESTS